MSSIMDVSSVKNVLAQDAESTQADEEIVFLEKLQGVINSWTRSWQSQNLNVYFLHYHADFIPEDFTTQAEWRKSRSIKILDPEYINISIRDFEILTQSNQNATVRFWMSYRRQDYADETLKEIKLINQNGLWLIGQERSIDVRAI
jgi:hypothetical protein